MKSKVIEVLSISEIESQYPNELGTYGNMMTDFTLRDSPIFNEGDHPISRKGPTLFQVVPKGF